MDKILHIINADKFSTGYINFMKICMKDYQHCFILLKNKYKLDLIDMDDVFIIDSYVQLLKNGELRKRIWEASKIILSGVFGVECYLLPYSKKVWKKIYMHFWGGDFYQYENCRSFSKKLHKVLFRYCVNNSNSLVFLIDKEYEKFCNIVNVEKKNMVAPMPGDPGKQMVYADFRNQSNQNPVKILVGNSATDSNFHEEVFELLRKYKDEKMEIYCPLSYGDEAYRDYVIDIGKTIFGEKFHPVLDFMDREEYKVFLSGFDMGIFNNNRQQGMGNITMLLGMGKKVYLRKDTTMWYRYFEEGNIIFPVEEIKNLSFEDFCYFALEDKNQNEQIADLRDPLEKAKKAWSLIFEERN